MSNKLPLAEIGKTYDKPVNLPFWETYIDVIGELPWPHIARHVAERITRFKDQREIVVISAQQLVPNQSIYRFRVAIVNPSNPESLSQLDNILGEMVPMRIIGSEVEIRKMLAGLSTVVEYGF